MPQNRRRFLQTTTAASAALLLNSLDAFAAANPASALSNKNFELKILATNWGFDGTVDAFCAKAKKEGYDGIEMWWPTDNKKAQEELFAALKAHSLEIGNGHTHLPRISPQPDAFCCTCR